MSSSRLLGSVIVVGLLASVAWTNANSAATRVAGELDCFKFTQTSENVCENCPPSGHSTACGTCPMGTFAGHACQGQSITECLKYLSNEEAEDGYLIDYVTLACWYKFYCVAPDGGAGHCLGSETCLKGSAITTGNAIGVQVMGPPCGESE